MPYPPLTVEQGATTLAIVVALGGTVLGAALWLAGSRFSRGVVTLTAVALGALVGREVPRWGGWTISPMGPTVAGALVLGLIAFILHRVWLGLVLGVILGGWVAGAVCLTTVSKDDWTWPTVDRHSVPQDVARELWNNLPASTQRMLPFAAALGLISGLACMIRWPRLATAMAYSVLGASLLIGMGLTAIQLLRPEWKAWVPERTSVQLPVVAGVAVVGTIIQWVIMPRPRQAPVAKKEEDEADVEQE